MSPVTIFAGLNCHCGERHTQGAAYYVSCRRDDRRHALLAGPYPEHSDALAVLNRVNRLAQDSGDPRACWYSYGTLAVLAGKRPDGVLNVKLAESLLLPEGCDCASLTAHRLTWAAGECAAQPPKKRARKRITHSAHTEATR